MVVDRSLIFLHGPFLCLLPFQEANECPDSLLFFVIHSAHIDNLDEHLNRIF